MSMYLEQPRAMMPSNTHFPIDRNVSIGESELSVFVDSTIKCFSTITGNSPKIGSPFLCESAAELISDYSGIINVSGNTNGAVVFSAPKRMLSHMLREQGLLSTKESLQIDLAGEVCNIISGNVRRKFGDSFLISPPKIKLEDFDPFPQARPKSTFVIPIEWHGLEARLIINLNT